MSLSSLIVQREVATMRQVEEALSRQVLYGGDLVTNLLEVAQLREDQLMPLVAEAAGLRAAAIGELPAPDPRVRALVPEELANRRAVMPLGLEGDRLVLAVGEPLPLDVLDELSFALGVRIEQRIAPVVRIRQAIAAWYGSPLERRMQRLVGRLGGEATDPGSLPPLLRSTPDFPAAPRPRSVPAPAHSPEPPPIVPTPTVQQPEVGPVSSSMDIPSTVMPSTELPPTQLPATELAPTQVNYARPADVAPPGWAEPFAPSPRAPIVAPAARHVPPVEPSPPPAEEGGPDSGFGDPGLKDRPYTHPSEPTLVSPARTAPPPAAAPAPVAPPTPAARQTPADAGGAEGARLRRRTTNAGPPPPRTLPHPPPQRSAYETRTSPEVPAARAPSRGAAPPPPEDTAEPPESFVQRGREGLVARPGRRRRGPLSLQKAQEELEAADDRDKLLDLFFDFSCQFFDYTALFVVHGDIAEGRDAFGSGASRETVASIGVPLDLPSLLLTARDQRAPVVVRPAATGLDQVLMTDLDRRTKTPIFVVPLVVRQRTVAVLLGDGGDSGVDGASQGDVTAFATLVGQGFERIIVRRKLGGFTGGAGAAGTPGAARVDPVRVRSKPARKNVPPIDRAAAVRVLGQALASDRPPAVQEGSPMAESVPPPPSQMLPEPAPAEAALARVTTIQEAVPLPAEETSLPQANEPPPAHLTPSEYSFVQARSGPEPPPGPSATPPPEPGPMGEADLFAQVSSLPPPPQVLVVRRPSTPPIPREEPDSGRDASPDELPPVSKNLIDVPFPPPPSRPLEPFPPARSARPRVQSVQDPIVLDDTPSIAVDVSSIEDADEDEPETTVEPLDETDAGLAHLLIEEASPEPALVSSKKVVVAPHLPPMSVRSAPESLPSVIVDVEREFSSMVDRLIEDAKDEQAEAELLRRGVHAMPAIMQRFPGPLTVKRESLDELSHPRVTDCGPILRLIAGQRRVALPFVLAQVDSRDPERRFWSTFLLSELAYPEAVPAVAARLFDDDDGTRWVARLAARAIAEVAPEVLVERLDAIVGDPAAGPERRAATLDTLGDIRDAIVVPALIGALGDENAEVTEAARLALVTVTRQDFGGDPRRWLSWWAANSSRHRVEWLIDALTHEAQPLRRVAGQELKALTKEYFGYYDDLPKRERERAQQRYREWWKSEGRARFRRGRES